MEFSTALQFSSFKKSVALVQSLRHTYKTGGKGGVETAPKQNLGQKEESQTETSEDLSCLNR